MDTKKSLTYVKGQRRNNFVIKNQPIVLNYNHLQWKEMTE